MLALTGTADIEPFWNDVDPKAVTSLSKFQRDEILAAVQRRSENDDAADVRLSFLGHFLVIVFGREKRSAIRRQSERIRRPVFTIRNLPLIVLLWGSVIYTGFSLLLPAIKDLLLLFL